MLHNLFEDDSDNLTRLLLEECRQPLYVISHSDYSVIYFNNAGKSFTPAVQTGENFFGHLCGRDLPCENCPVKQKNEEMMLGVLQENPCSFAMPLFFNVNWAGEKAVLSFWNNVEENGDMSGYFLPNINVAKTLSGFGGSYSAYRNILSVYHEVGESKKKLLTELLGKNDRENFRIEIHGLKGTSYAIGADLLGNHAKKLEDLARKSEENDDVAFEMIKADIDSFITEYSAILNEIRPFVNIEDSDTVDRIELNADELKECIEELITLISDYEIDDAEEKVKILQKCSVDEKTASLINEAVDEFKIYNYDQAIEYLKQIIE